MSELKAFDIVVAEEGYCEGFVKYRRAVYDKAEADKVIAELKKACNDKDDWCLLTLKENRHHKYKLCLEMAKTLDRDATISNFMIVTEKEDGQKENHKKKAAFYRKWSNKWLDLAEYYKEGI